VNHFADCINARIKELSPLIIGIDPHLDLMPNFLLPSNVDEIQESLFHFGSSVIDVVADIIPAVKFQSAFYEQYGSEGVCALGRSIQYAKSKGLLVILDAKRGDIGSTSLAYATGYLKGVSVLKNGVQIPSNLEVDCITVNPFLGLDSMQPWIETALSSQKGIFVLVKTSNPGSGEFQEVQVGAETISEKLARLVHNWGKDSIGSTGYSCVGAVVGSTFPQHMQMLRKIMPNALFLVPGSGAQGGTLESARLALDSNGLGAVISVSREATYPFEEIFDVKTYQSTVRQQVLRLRSKLQG
jgi:orotidine-5'-phosphate decarboxylase